MGLALAVCPPTGLWRRRLRRFVYRDRSLTCPGGYHNASAPIESTFDDPRDARGYIPTSADHWPADDPRWPAHCDACPYVFTPEDPRQLWNDQELQHPDGRFFTDRDWMTKTAPIGAMWRAPWMDRGGELGWLVVLPDSGTWITTQEASSPGGRWTVTGTPPAITVSPSIFHNPQGTPPGWHGFIRDGVLEPA